MIDWRAKAIDTVLEAMMIANSFKSPKQTPDIPWHCVGSGRKSGDNNRDVVEWQSRSLGREWRNDD
jgi:hypothetical protein